MSKQLTSRPKMGGVPEASNPRLIGSSLIKKDRPVGIKPASEPTDKKENGLYTTYTTEETFEIDNPDGSAIYSNSDQNVYGVHTKDKTTGKWSSAHFDSITLEQLKSEHPDWFRDISGKHLGISDMAVSSKDVGFDQQDIAATKKERDKVSAEIKTAFENNNQVIPGFDITTPIQEIRVHIKYFPDQPVQTGTVGEVVHVYLPNNDNDSSGSAAHNGQSDYTYELDQNITGKENDFGVMKWNPVTFDAQNIIDLLKQAIFTNDKTGMRNQKVKIDLNEYTPVIEYAQASSPDESKNIALYDRLTDYLKAYLKAHNDTTTLPEFEIDYPGTAIFGVHFVKKSNPGDDNNPGGNDNNPGDNTPDNPGNNNNNPGNTTPTTPTNPSNNNNNPGNNNKGNKTPENNTHKKSNPSKKNNRHNQKHYNENSGVKNSNVRARHLSNVNAKAEKAANGQVLSANSNKISENSVQNNKTNANVKSLPATGEEQTHLGLIGLALASFAALIGLAADRKRN